MACRGALGDVGLYLSGALHVTLCLTSIALRRRSLGLLYEAAIATKIITVEGQVTSHCPDAYRVRPSAVRVDRLVQPRTCQQTLLKQGVCEQDGLCEPSKSSKKKKKRHRLAGHVVVESYTPASQRPSGDCQQPHAT